MTEKSTKVSTKEERRLGTCLHESMGSMIIGCERDYMK